MSDWFWWTWSSTVLLVHRIEIAMNETPDKLTAHAAAASPPRAGANGTLLLGILCCVVPAAFLPAAADPAVPLRWWLAALVTAWLAWHTAQGGRLLPAQPAVRRLLLALAAAVGVAALGATPSFNRLGGVRLLLCGLFFLTGAAVAARHRQTPVVARLWWATGLGTTLCTLVGLLQVAGIELPQISQAFAPASLFVNKNVAAAVLVLSAPVWFGLAMVVSGRWGWAWRVAAVLHVAFLLAVASRTAQLVCLINGPLCALWVAARCDAPRWWFKQFALNGALIAVGLVVLPRVGAWWSAPLQFTLWWSVTAATFGAVAACRQRGLAPAAWLPRLLPVLLGLFVVGNLLLWRPPAFLLQRLALVSAQTNPDPHVNTVMVRSALYRNATAMVLTAPLGVGSGNFRHVYPLYHDAVTPTPTHAITVHPERVHNDWLQFAVEHGVVGGLLLWLLLFVLLFRAATAAEVDVAATALPALIVANGLLCASFSFPLQMPASAFLFWLAAGLLAPARAPVAVVGWGRRAGVVSLALLQIGLAVYLGRYLYGQLLLAEANKWQAAGNVPFAFVYSNHAARVFPDDPTALDQVVTLAALHGRNMQQARALADAFTTRYPNHANGWFRRAFILRKAGDPQAALADAARALALSGPDAAGHVFCGETHEMLGAHAEARAAYEAALRATPLYTPAVLRLQAMDAAEHGKPR